ncbi:50S ribosomal protein L3 [Candidatus Poribacteria bacterium]|nr:50S ribosomal protein L3 [Candidatus Poribacteria bacterium]
MSAGLIGRKVGMTRIFDDSGAAVSVTVIEAGPCPVVQVKTAATDNYSAIQLAYGARKRANRPTQGHFAKAEAEPSRHLREFRVDDTSEFSQGQVLDVEAVFAEGEYVDVAGITKGRGFAGVVKKFDFRGGDGSHGGEKDLRRGGSIGTSATPSRVVKGRKMPGHFGHARHTVQNLKVMHLDAEKNLLVVSGSVPGPSGGVVLISKAVKRGNA